METIKFASQISELKAALLFFKRTQKELKDLLKKEELESMNAYLSTSSYAEASVLTGKDPVMIYIYVKNAIVTLNIFKSLVIRKKKKIKKRAFTRS
jgi:serine/threonine-protein kinase RIO1